MKFRSLAIFIMKRVIPLVLVLALAALLLILLFFDSVAQALFRDAVRGVPGDLRVSRFSPSLGGVTLKDVRWTLSSREPVFEASEIFLNIGLRNLARRDWYKSVTVVRVRKPGLRVTVDQHGNVNLLSLLSAASDRPTLDVTAIRTRVELEDGWILYHDRRDSGFLYELSNWTGSFRLEDGKTVQFETAGNPNGDQESLFGLSGWVALERPQLVVTALLDNFHLEPFTGFPGFGPGLTYVRGVVDGSIRVSGEGINWTEVLADAFMLGELTLSQGAFRAPGMPASFTELDGQAQLLGSDVSTQSFQGRFADIGFEISGKAGIGAGSEVDGVVSTERFLLSKLNSLLADPLPVSGEARAVVRASGDLENLLLSGSLYGYDLEAQDQKVQVAQADFLKADDLLYLPQILATTSAGNLKGEGWVFLGDEIRVLFELHGDDTRPDVVMPGLAQSADFTVRVLGDPSNPTVFGQGSATGLGEWAQGLSRAQGKFIFSGDDLMLYEGQASSGSSVVNLEVGSYETDTRQFSGLLSALDFRTEDVPGLQGVSGHFSGQALVEADLSGETPRVEAQAVLTSGQFQSGDLALSEARGEAYYDGSQVVIPWASSLFRGSEVELAGVYDTRNSALKASVSSPNFDLAALGMAGESANLTASVEGRIDGDVGVYGIAQSHRGKAALSGIRRSSGRLSGVAWIDGTQDGVEVETVVVADGTPTSMNFDYTGQLGGPQLAGLGPLNLFGAANLSGNTLRVQPTLLSAPDAGRETTFYPMVTYSGAAYSFFGPLMAGPLEKVVIEESPFPVGRSAVVAGTANLGTGALDMKYHLQAAGLEDAPFSRLMEGPLPFSLVSGYGTMGGRVLGTLGDPKVEAGFHLPWLMLENAHQQRLTMGMSGRMALGKRIVEVPSLTVAENPFDRRLLQESPEIPGDGLLGVSGNLKSDQTFDVRLKTQGFSPSFLAFFAPAEFARFVPSGRIATDSLHLWGTLAQPSVAGMVRLLRGGIMVADEPYSINSAFLDFSSQDGEIRIPELGLVAPGIEITGSLKRRSGGQLEGAIVADDIELSKMARFEPVLAGVKGHGDLVIKLGGTFPAAPRAEVGFRAENLLWNPRFIGGRERQVAIERLTLGIFDEQDVPNLIEGLTFAPSDDGIFLQLPAEGFRFQRAADGLKMTVGGAVNLPTGGLSNFKTFHSVAEYFASPYGPDFGRGGEPLTLRVESLNTRELSRLLGRRTRGLDLSTSFGMNLEGQWWRDHQKNAGGSLPRYEMAFEELSFQSGPRGERTGFGLNHPATVLYQREGTAGYLNLRDIEVGFTRQEEIPPEPLTENTEEDEPPRPRYNQVREGVMQAAGRLAVTRLPGTAPESHFVVDAEDIPLANLDFLLPNLPLSGMVDFLDVNLAGVLPSPRLSVQGEVTDFGLGPVKGMDVEGSLTAFEQDGAYQIVVGEEVDEGITVTFADDDVTSHGAKIDGDATIYWVKDSDPNPGRLELFAKNLSISLDSPVNLIAHLIDKNLAILSDIVPGEDITSGTLVGEIAATGTLRRPEFEGHAKLENGSFVSERYGRFESLNLDAELIRITREEAVPSPALQASSSGLLTRFNLHQFAGTLGGQPFFAGGVAELAGMAPTLLNLQMTGQNLPIRIPELYVGRMDMNLELSGREIQSGGQPALRPELTGLMVFPAGDFHIPMGSLSDDSATASEEEEEEEERGRRRRRREPPPEGPRVPFDVSLDLSLGSEFFVNALNSRVRAVGDLQVRAFDGVAKVYGEVALSRGTIRIPFYDASFRVRQGVAVFDGPFVPRLEEVEAVADLGGYRITARANGRYPDTFTLDLYSDPPLPQAELSRIAVLGGLPSSLTGQQDPNQSSGALGTLGTTGVSFLSGMLTNRLTEQIASTFFLSELSFDYIPPATYAIKIAKALDPNDRFLLTVTRIIRDNGLNENLFGIEWRLSPQFLLRTAFDQLARPRFWVQSINRF